MTESKFLVPPVKLWLTPRTLREAEDDWTTSKNIKRGRKINSHIIVAYHELSAKNILPKSIHPDI